MITVPNLTSPVLAELLTLQSNLDSRERLVKAEVNRLRTLIADGELPPDDKEARIALILNGEAIPATADLTAQLRTAMLQWQSLDDAKEVLSRRISKAKDDASRTICSDLKPQYDKLATRFCAALVDAHAVHVEMIHLQQQLMDKEIGCRAGVCNLSPSAVLDSPFNRSSDLAELFRDAVKHGQLKALPVQFR